ncbi:MAG: ABC transporter ATP-binding protein [Planctomycetota bacterium]
MASFWRYVRQIFRYRLMVGFAAVAVLLDAITAFSGFGGAIAVIRYAFNADPDKPPIRDIAAQKLADPAVTQYIGDWSHLANIIPADRFMAFAFILGGVLLLSAFGGVMRYFHQTVVITLCLRLAMKIRLRAFKRVLHAPYEKLMGSQSGDMISRINFDTLRLSIGLQALLGRSIRDLTMGLVFILWAFLINWRLTILFLIALPIIGLLTRKFGKKVRKASKGAMEHSGQMVGSMQESMLSPQVVRVHNAEGYERRRFMTLNRKLYKQELKARTAKAMSSPTTEFVALCGVIGVTLLAAWYIVRVGQGNAVSTGFALISIALAGGSLKPLAKLNNDLQESAAAANRLDEVLQLPAEPGVRLDRDGNVEEPKAPDLARHTQSIRFDQVSYHYPNAEGHAIERVNLELPHGKTIAIVGPNGSGKSTLLSMLPRLIEPTAGRVLVDGTDIRGVSLRSLRKQIAMVTQQSVLFTGTIAENIAYGRGHTPRQQIIEAAEAAHAHEFIDKLADGYDHRLGEGGAGLSGGQRQRVCIARAILRDPAIFILDEATSQIDTDSEAKINDALRQIRRGRTFFVIAHRMSTVIDSDAIIVLDQGKVVGQGTHQELMMSCETYRVLFNRELAG